MVPPGSTICLTIKQAPVLLSVGKMRADLTTSVCYQNKNNNNSELERPSQLKNKASAQHARTLSIASRASITPVSLAVTPCHWSSAEDVTAHCGHNDMFSYLLSPRELCSKTHSQIIGRCISMLVKAHGLRQVVIFTSEDGNEVFDEAFNLLDRVSCEIENIRLHVLDMIHPVLHPHEVIKRTHPP